LAASAYLLGSPKRRFFRDLVDGFLFPENTSPLALFFELFRERDFHPTVDLND
jgi:hypothetical protein